MVAIETAPFVVFISRVGGERMTFMSRRSPVRIPGTADVLVCEERWRLEFGSDVTASLCGLVG